MMLVDGAPIDYSGLPEFCRDIVRRYIEAGCHPGFGWCAILAHDLTAINIVDSETAAALPKLMRWLHAKAPSNCHGAYDKVERWMKVRQMERPE